MPFGIPKSENERRETHKTVYGNTKIPKNRRGKGMPYRMTEVDGYSVSGPSGKKSKKTTLRKAKAQMRLLYGVEHGWKPTGKRSNLK